MINSIVFCINFNVIIVVFFMIIIVLNFLKISHLMPISFCYFDHFFFIITLTNLVPFCKRHIDKFELLKFLVYFCLQ